LASCKRWSIIKVADYSLLGRRRRELGMGWKWTRRYRVELLLKGWIRGGSTVIGPQIHGLMLSYVLSGRKRSHMTCFSLVLSFGTYDIWRRRYLGWDPNFPPSLIFLFCTQTKNISMFFPYVWPITKTSTFSFFLFGPLLILIHLILIH
jgi:hypothetical protein